MRYIIYAVILAVIVMPSWQIGSIMLEKKEIEVMLEKNANSFGKYRRVEPIETNLKNSLKKHGFTTEFTTEILEEGSGVKIDYPFNRVASVFGHTYYETNETLTAETKR